MEQRIEGRTSLAGLTAAFAGSSVATVKCGLPLLLMLSSCLKPEADIVHPDSGGVDGSALDAGLQDAGWDAGVDAGTAYGCVVGGAFVWYPVTDVDAGFGDAGFVAGQTLPDLPLGQGYFDVSDPPVPADSLPVGPIYLHDLFCSGARFALIDLAAIWCTRDQRLAQTLQSQAAAFIGKGGLIVELLEEGSVDPNPPSLKELKDWATRFGINFTVTAEPDQLWVRMASLQVWPTDIIVDLTTMKVRYVVEGPGDDALSVYLDGGIPPGGI